MTDQIKTTAAQIGISASNLQLFLDLYAIEVKGGASVEDAIFSVDRLLVNLTHQSQLPLNDQAAWFRAYKAQIAADVWTMFHKTA